MTSGEFSILCYPFRHTVGKRGGERVLSDPAINDRWELWWHRLPDSRSPASAFTEAVDDSYFFLPSARSFLFPDLDELEQFDPSSTRSVAGMASLLKEKLRVTNSLADFAGPHRINKVGVDQPTSHPSSCMRLSLKAGIGAEYPDLAVHGRRCVDALTRSSDLSMQRLALMLPAPPTDPSYDASVRF